MSKKLLIKCPNCNKDNNLVNFGTHYICLNCGGEKYSIEEVEKGLMEYRQKANEVKEDE